MEDLKRAFSDCGLICPTGLEHLLWHTGSTRKEVYRALYGILVYGKQLAKAGTTLVYPDAIKEAVRSRFKETDAGKYDGQYANEGRKITMEEISKVDFRVPKSCPKCREMVPKPTKEKRFKPY